MNTPQAARARVNVEGLLRLLSAFYCKQECKGMPLYDFNRLRAWFDARRVYLLTAHIEFCNADDSLIGKQWEHSRVRDETQFPRGGYGR